MEEIKEGEGKVQKEKVRNDKKQRRKMKNNNEIKTGKRK